MRTFLAILCGVLLMAGSEAEAKSKLVIEIEGEGEVVITLLQWVAPKHVERVKTLAKQGFYDGTVFHRVIEGFMAQGGDPTGTGTGGSDLPDLRSEFTDVRGFRRGTVGAARTQHPHTANSQFFITFGDASFLNGQYTIWGEVEKGMEHVDALPRGEPPRSPGRIKRAYIKEE